ncbi:MAG: hypothetical protein SFV21_09955 [Rhodospirillaceae bacterium]|nr:hypothetical protein [Rhodospirillaceae bacterium]
MTLTALQRRVLQAIASNRDTSSYVAGGAALNRTRLRVSDDLDIFIDPGASLAEIAERDIAAIRSAGLDVTDFANHYGLIAEATVSDGHAQTQIQWQDETRRRFLPVVSDQEFGVRLSDADLAINKVLAAAFRRAARDFVDLVAIQRDYAPLGPLVWAACAKTELGPVALIDRIRQNARSLSDQEYATVRMAGGRVRKAELMSSLEEMLAKAEAFQKEAPPEHYGKLFLDTRGSPIAATKAAIDHGAVIPIPLSEYGPIVPVVLPG